MQPIPSFIVTIPGRETEAQKTFESLQAIEGLAPPQMVGATPPPKQYFASNCNFAGEAGCSLSHIKALLAASQLSRPYVAIFEDDVDARAFSLHGSGITALLGKRAPIVFLGCRPASKAEPICADSNEFLEVGHTYGSYGYMIRTDYAAKLAAAFVDRFCMPHPFNCADSVLCVHDDPRKNIAVFPPVVFPRPGQSAIRGSHRDYGEITAKAWAKWGPPETPPNAALELPANYQRRLEPKEFVDTLQIHERYQQGVYDLARYFSAGGNVLDVGCGMAAKTFSRFRQDWVTGIEPNKYVLQGLKERYPLAEFFPSLERLGQFKTKRFPLMICADVIEHLPDPVAFLQELQAVDFETGIISTPDRDTLNNPSGPPRNPAHCQEWSQSEFARLVGRFFHICSAHTFEEPAGYTSQALVITKK